MGTLFIDKIVSIVIANLDKLLVTPQSNYKLRKKEGWMYKRNTKLRLARGGKAAAAGEEEEIGGAAAFGG